MAADVTLLQGEVTENPEIRPQEAEAKLRDLLRALLAEQTGAPGANS